MRAINAGALMPDFEFTSPEGQRFTVTGPAGSTTEQAWSVLQQHLGSANNQGDSGDRRTINISSTDGSNFAFPEGTPLDEIRAAWRSPLDLIDCTSAFSPFLETAKIAHVRVS
jgi:hypothetical protein